MKHKCPKCTRVYDDKYNYCPVCGEKLISNHEAEIEIFDNGIIQTVKLNGEDISAGCCGVNVEVLPRERPKVTLTYLPSKAYINGHGDDMKIFRCAMDYQNGSDKKGGESIEE